MSSRLTREDLMEQPVYSPLNDGSPRTPEPTPREGYGATANSKVPHSRPSSTGSRSDLEDHLISGASPHQRYVSSSYHRKNSAEDLTSKEYFVGSSSSESDDEEHPTDEGYTPNNSTLNSMDEGSSLVRASQASTLHSFVDTTQGSSFRESRKKNLSTKQICMKRMKRVLQGCAVICMPLFIGALISFVAWQRKRTPIFINDRDWVVLMAIGISSQISIVSVLLNALYPDAARVLVSKLHTQSDYYSPFVIYPSSSVFLCIVAVRYAFLEYKQRKKSKRSSSNLSEWRQKSILLAKERLRDVVKLRSDWIIIPISVFAGFMATFGLRFCAIGASCSHNSAANQFFDEAYMKEPLFVSAAVFSFCQFFQITAITLLGVVMFYQHWRVIDIFTFPNKIPFHLRGVTTTRRNKKRARSDSPSVTRGKVDWHDLSHPEGVATYFALFNEIVGDMNHHPAVVAISTPSFAVAVILFLVGAAFIVFSNVYQSGKFAIFSVVALAIVFIAVSIISAFIIITMKLDKTINEQSSIIAKVQNDVQLQIDALRMEGGGTRNVTQQMLRILEAKVNALQALDVYVRYSDSSPKLIGMSLNTLRWTTIFSLLLFINMFFLLLYHEFCV